MVVSVSHGVAVSSSEVLTPVPLEMTVVPLPTPVNVTPAVPEGLRLGKVVIKLAESTLLEYPDIP